MTCLLTLSEAIELLERYLQNSTCDAQAQDWPALKAQCTALLPNLVSSDRRALEQKMKAVEALQLRQQRKAVKASTSFSCDSDDEGEEQVKRLELGCIQIRSDIHTQELPQQADSSIANQSSQIFDRDSGHFDSQQLKGNWTLQLKHLSSCIVHLDDNPPANVHASQLKSCVIILSAHTGSLMLSNCHDCLFIAPYQQIRIHESVNCIIGLGRTTSAMTEHCQAIKVFGLGQIHDFQNLLDNDTFERLSPGSLPFKQSLNKITSALPQADTRRALCLSRSQELDDL